MSYAQIRIPLPVIQFLAILTKRHSWTETAAPYDWSEYVLDVGSVLYRSLSVHSGIGRCGTGALVLGKAALLDDQSDGTKRAMGMI